MDKHDSSQSASNEKENNGDFSFITEFAKINQINSPFQFKMTKKEETAKQENIGIRENNTYSSSESVTDENVRLNLDKLSLRKIDENKENKLKKETNNFNVITKESNEIFNKTEPLVNNDLQFPPNQYYYTNNYMQYNYPINIIIPPNYYSQNQSSSFNQSKSSCFNYQNSNYFNNNNIPPYLFDYSKTQNQNIHNNVSNNLQPTYEEDFTSFQVIIKYLILIKSDNDFTAFMNKVLNCFIYSMHKLKNSFERIITNFHLIVSQVKGPEFIHQLISILSSPERLHLWKTIIKLNYLNDPNLLKANLKIISLAKETIEQLAIVNNIEPYLYNIIYNETGSQLIKLVLTSYCSEPQYKIISFLYDNYEALSCSRISQEIIYIFISIFKDRPSHMKESFLQSLAPKIDSIIDNKKGYKSILSILKEWKYSETEVLRNKMENNFLKYCLGSYSYKVIILLLRINVSFIFNNIEDKHFSKTFAFS